MNKKPRNQVRITKTFRILPKTLEKILELKAKRGIKSLGKTIDILAEN
jgi:hypothetical protein